MMSLIHILNNYHDPFPHLKGRGGLQFHPSRRIIGGALSNQLAQQQVTDMIAQIKETELPEKIDYPDVDDYIEKIENKLQASEPEPEPEQYLTNEEIKDIKISKYNNKDKLAKLAKSMKLPTDGTNNEIKERIKKRIEKANEKPVEKEKPKKKEEKEVVKPPTANELKDYNKFLEIQQSFFFPNVFLLEKNMNKIPLTSEESTFVKNTRDTLNENIGLDPSKFPKSIQILKELKTINDMLYNELDKQAENLSKEIISDEDAKEQKKLAKEAKRTEIQRNLDIKMAQEKAEEEERLEKIRIKQERNDKAIKHYEDTLKKKALSSIGQYAKESMSSKINAKINAKIPLVEDALRQRQETKPYLSLSPESILKLATRLYKKKTLQPWQAVSDYQMNQQGIEFTIDEPLKREYDIQKSNYEYMSTNIIPYVKKKGMEGVEYGIGYENWLSNYGQSLMKKITGTTSDIKNSKEHTNIVGDVKAYYVYDYFNDESELEVKYYHRPEDSYFKLLKDDTKGYPFQKSKFIGGDNSKGSFKPYFIMDNGRLKLYNILQTYVAPDGSIEKVWINDTINKEVYFSVCCADTIIYLNMNDDLVLRINSVSNPQIYDKNGKKIKNAPSILKQIDIEGMITHGDVLKNDDKWIQIQAKKFKQVENI
jgi:hypothetical protein